MLTNRSRSIVLFTVLLTALLTLPSCITVGELTPKETYHEAQLWYNFNLEQYLNYYDVLDADTQAELKEDVDPVFARASKALEAWGKVVGAGTEQEKFAAWSSVKNQVIVELLALGL